MGNKSKKFIPAEKARLANLSPSPHLSLGSDLELHAFAYLQSYRLRYESRHAVHVTGGQW
jgi:hypothetical protein